ncbi:MAG TPA: FixH family protein [Allosphingosinicella sp.]
MTRRFTGWHMFAILIAFFGVVIAVNITMAMFATRTFGGTVVDNSYVASQKFNGWLAAARAQEELGWQSKIALDESRHVAVTVADANGPLAGIAVTALARHPLGREADVPLRFVTDGEGRVRSAEPLPAGRWLVHLEIRRGSEAARLVENLS